MIPGLRLNVSQRGVSASIGGSPFTLNVETAGVKATASIPGSGLSFHRNLLNSHPKISATAPPENTRPVFPDSLGSSPTEHIQSGSTERMTSATLLEVKELIHTAQIQMNSISSELDEAVSAKVDAEAKFESWYQGFLLRRLFKNKFQVRKENAEAASTHVKELEHQLELSRIATSFEIAEEQAEFYFKMSDAFAVLANVERVWDVQTHQKTDRFKERTTAAVAVERLPVRFDLCRCDLINWDKSVPHMKNAKGGEIFCYPSFVLYRVGKQAFSLLEYHEFQSRATTLRFQEAEKVHTDSQVVGQTWAKANKDGSPDRRFANNHRIPIVLYGELSLKSSTGLWEEFQTSDPIPLLKWNLALASYCCSLAGATKEQIEANG